MRTYSPKPADIQREWLVIDATDVVLGRLAVQTANLLRGKHKPTFAPHMDMGDFVIIVNAEKIALSGNKKTTKMAYRHSGYPGGLTATPFGELLEKDAYARFKYDATAQQDGVIIEQVAEIAEKRNVSMTEVSLAWLMTKVTAPVVGATKLHHIEGAVKAAELKLTAEEIAYLEEPYVPHKLVGMMASK